MYRSPTKRQGRTAVSEQQLRRGYSSTPGGSPTTGMSKIVSIKTASDFVIDGSLFRLDVFHGLPFDDYIYQIYETDDGSETLPHKVSREKPYLRIWFPSESKNYTIIIIG